jgi:hypothetical protein
LFVLRSVAETSMPFIVDTVRNKFKELEVYIVTRDENLMVMSNIKGVTGVFEVKSLSFNYKDNIVGLEYIDDSDIVIIPITNKSKMPSYGNVLRFAKSIFKKSKIFYCTFDSAEIIQHIKPSLSNYLEKIFYLLVSILLIMPLFFAFILYSVLRIIFKKKNKKDYVLGQ